MVKIYVEGGGNRNPSLVQDCRKGFKQFFTNAGFKNAPQWLLVVRVRWHMMITVSQ